MFESSVEIVEHSYPVIQNPIRASYMLFELRIPPVRLEGSAVVSVAQIGCGPSASRLEEVAEDDEDKVEQPPRGLNRPRERVGSVEDDQVLHRVTIEGVQCNMTKTGCPRYCAYDKIVEFHYNVPLSA